MVSPQGHIEWFLHIGIANEMEIHFSVLPISRHGKISQTQKDKQLKLPSSPFQTWRASEIKGASFVYYFAIFNNLELFNTSTEDVLSVFLFPCQRVALFLSLYIHMSSIFYVFYWIFFFFKCPWEALRTQVDMLKLFCLTNGFIQPNSQRAKDIQLSYMTKKNIKLSHFRSWNFKKSISWLLGVLKVQNEPIQCSAIKHFSHCHADSYLPTGRTLHRVEPGQQWLATSWEMTLQNSWHSSGGRKGLAGMISPKGQTWKWLSALLLILGSFSLSRWLEWAHNAVYLLQTSFWMFNTGSRCEGV